MGKKVDHVVGGLQLETNMLGAGRLLFSCTLRRSREVVASSLHFRCRSIRTLSYLNHLQTRFACYTTTPFWRSTLLPSSQAGRHLSLVTTNYKPETPENAGKSSRIAEELELVEDAGSPTQPLRQGGYVREDNIKWWKSPEEVKQIRFTRHIDNLVRKGKVGEAHEVFEQMKEAQVQPNEIIFNVLITGYRKEGDVQACFKLFNEVSLIRAHKVDLQFIVTARILFLKILFIFYHLSC